MTSPNLDRFYKEFWHDYEKGELKSVEEYVRRYPDHEAEIREVRFYDEFWHDYEKGELKPVEEYVRRYPDHETEIREA